MKSSSAHGPRDVDVELLKAVAQAWHAHSGNPRPPRASATPGDEDEAGVGRARRAGCYRPSRFKLEAMAAQQGGRPWDFAQSLWDTYELVTIAQKLESSLLIADQAVAAPRAGAKEGAAKRARESRRSLRNLFRRSSSRRFQESTG